jgi:gas vesicle protein
MENNNNNHNGSGNGFLLGVIVGVLATLLFTTKRGRAILKDVMERGIDKFANLEELMRETEEGYDEELEDEGDDYIPSEPVEPEPVNVPKVEKKTTGSVAQTQPAEKAQEPKPAKEPVPEPAKIVEEEKIETVGQTPVEEKPKTTRVKRLFRGLRKKS